MLLPIIDKVREKMKDISLAAPCGLYCGDCDYLESQCQGCSQVQGKPFWTAQLEGNICPFYKCCINQKQLEHCGLCPEFPCEPFTSLRDPSQSDEEAEKSLRQRLTDLRLRKEIGTETWLIK